MKIIELVENTDGSATIQVDMAKEETAQLIEYALLDLLTKAAKANKEMNESID